MLFVVLWNVRLRSSGLNAILLLSKVSLMVAQNEMKTVIRLLITEIHLTLIPLYFPDRVDYRYCY